MPIHDHHQNAKNTISRPHGYFTVPFETVTNVINNTKDPIAAIAYLAIMQGVDKTRGVIKGNLISTHGEKSLMSTLRKSQSAVWEICLKLINLHVVHRVPGKMPSGKAGFPPKFLIPSKRHDVSVPKALFASGENLMKDGMWISLFRDTGFASQSGLSIQQIQADAITLLLKVYQHCDYEKYGGVDPRMMGMKFVPDYRPGTKVSLDPSSQFGNIFVRRVTEQGAWTLNSDFLVSALCTEVDRTVSSVSLQSRAREALRLLMSPNVALLGSVTMLYKEIDEKLAPLYMIYDYWRRLDTKLHFAHFANRKLIDYSVIESREFSDRFGEFSPPGDGALYYFITSDLEDCVKAMGVIRPRFRCFTADIKRSIDADELRTKLAIAAFDKLIKESGYFSI